MTTQPASGRIALWMSPAIVVAAAFFASIPWLRDTPDPVVWAVTAAAATFLMGHSLAVAWRVARASRSVEGAGS